MGGIGGGGGVNIPQRDFRKEFGQIFHNAWPQDRAAYRDFVGSEPLLSESHDFALNNLENVGSLTNPLFQAFQTLPGQLGGYIDQLGNLSRQMGQLAPGLKRTMANLPNPRTLAAPMRRNIGTLQNLIGNQQGTYNALNPIIARQGALTPEQAHQQDQQIFANLSAQGMANTSPAAFQAALNRDQYRRERFNEALGQQLGLSGSIGSLAGQSGALSKGIEDIFGENAATKLGLTQGLQSIYGGQGNLIGQQGNMVGQQAGILNALGSGIQGLQQGALNQTLGTEQAQTGNFATLMNPIFSYMQDLNSSNQNAAAAQSIAGGNKSSGLISGAGSLLGSIAMAY